MPREMLRVSRSPHPESNGPGIKMRGPQRTPGRSAKRPACPATTRVDLRGEAAAGKGEAALLNPVEGLPDAPRDGVVGKRRPGTDPP